MMDEELWLVFGIFYFILCTTSNETKYMISAFFIIMSLLTNDVRVLEGE